MSRLKALQKIINWLNSLDKNKANHNIVQRWIQKHWSATFVTNGKSKFLIYYEVEVKEKAVLYL